MQVFTSRHRTQVCLLTLLASIALVSAVPVSAQRGDEPPDGVSAGDWSGIKAAHEAARHEARPEEDGYRATNPGQGWQLHFDGRGFTTRPDSGTWTWGLELERYGFAGHERSPELPQAVSAEGARVAYDWDATLEEWYVNDARGLEHGYTVHRRPPGAGDGPLAFALAVRGELRPEVSHDGRDVRFVDPDGAAVLTYSGLAVFDAEGHPLPARLEPRPEGLRLTVDERGAAYPLTIDPVAQQAYLKASNAGFLDHFGASVAVSGNTVVVGAWGEFSNATGVNGDESDNTAPGAGAAYVFVRNGTSWSQQAYLKASNTDTDDRFGFSVAVSGDTVVVGAPFEDSNATGVDGDGSDDSATLAGAAYVFVRNGTSWSQQAYLKASNTDASDRFGISVAVSGDTVVAGAWGEDSNATGVNGNEGNSSDEDSGAAYVFVRSGTSWSQQAYLKASNTELQDQFGQDVAVSGDTIAVGAPVEDGNATGVNGNDADNSADGSGAAFVFVRSGTSWSQQAYLKASNTDAGDLFGLSVAITGDTIAVGSPHEESSATGVNGNEGDNNSIWAGAAYVFVRSGTSWSQQAYLKASNTDPLDSFGVFMSIEGDALVVGAIGEDSSANVVDGDQSDNSAAEAGAVYLFVRSGTSWSQTAYLKASNTDAGDGFTRAAVSGDIVVVAAEFEGSAATGIDGDQSSNSSPDSGAAYVFDLNGDVPNQILPAQLPGDPVLTDTGGAPGIGPKINDPTEAFDVALDCSGMFTGGVYTIVIRSSSLITPATTGFGDVWVTGLKLIKSGGAHAQNTVSWGSVVLPNDMSLVGLPFTSQGFCTQIGGGSRVSTGLVQTIGL